MKFQSLKEELLKIKTFELSVKSGFSIKSLFWLTIALLGTVWFCFFMTGQVRLWNENKIVISKAQIGLADLKNPSITLCSKRVNKVGVADRFGNYLNPKSKVDNKFLSWIKKSAIKCAAQKIEVDMEEHNIKDELLQTCPKCPKCPVCEVHTALFQELYYIRGPTVLYPQNMRKFTNCTSKNATY